jgi:hypothetical protein
MLEYPTKTDEVSVLPAVEVNNYYGELKSIVTASGQSFSGSSVIQASRGISRYVTNGASLEESGTSAPDSYKLVRIASGLSVLESPGAYYKGFVVSFFVVNTNTGASDINVLNIGTVPLKQIDGSDLAPGNLTAGEYVSVYFDGSLFLLLKQNLQPSAFTYPRSLKVFNNSVSPDSKVDIELDSWDFIILEDTEGKSIKVKLPTTITIDITADLDTGSEAPSTWYYIYLSTNATGSAVNGFFSTSLTAPVLPGSDIYKSRIAAFYNNAGGNFNRHYKSWFATVMPRVVLVNAGTAGTPTAVNMAAVVPPTATHVFGEIFPQNLGTGNARVNLYSTLAPDFLGYNRAKDHAGSIIASTSQFNQEIRVPQTIYYELESGSNTSIHSNGYWE